MTTQQDIPAQQDLKSADDLITLGKCPTPQLRAQMKDSVKNVCDVDLQTINTSITKQTQSTSASDDSDELQVKDTTTQKDTSDDAAIVSESEVSQSEVSQSEVSESAPQSDQSVETASQPNTQQESKKDDDNNDNPMKKIYLEKIVLNMGMGRSGESINIAKKALEQITQGSKPSQRNARDSQRDWGVRKGEPIGVSVTVRGDKAHELLKRLLEAKGNVVNGRSFDNFGNYSFGIREHIDIPGVKYEPQIGILGLGVSVALARPGYSIRKRSKHRASIGHTHVISREDAKRFIVSKFGVEVAA